jgi:hypothetical protein
VCSLLCFHVCVCVPRHFRSGYHRWVLRRQRSSFFVKPSTLYNQLLSVVRTALRVFRVITFFFIYSCNSLRVLRVSYLAFDVWISPLGCPTHVPWKFENKKGRDLDFDTRPPSYGNLPTLNKLQAYLHSQPFWKIGLCAGNCVHVRVSDHYLIHSFIRAFILCVSYIVIFFFYRSVNLLSKMVCVRATLAHSLSQHPALSSIWSWVIELDTKKKYRKLLRYQLSTSCPLIAKNACIKYIASINWQFYKSTAFNKDPFFKDMCSSGSLNDSRTLWRRDVE